MQVAEMKVGDLYPRPRLRLQADGVGVDLSEAVSVVARVRLPGATESVEREVTVADQDVTANFGIVTIVLVAGDTDYRGTIKFDIEVTWATGVQTWPSKGYFKIWLLEDADSAQGGAIPLTSQHDALTLGRLYDVTIDDPEDGQVLQYDDTLGRWVNTAGAPDHSAYFTISRGNVASAEYAGNDIEWRIGAAASQSSVFAMENSEATALTIETLTTNSAVLRAGSALNENLYLFNDRGIAVNVQDNAAALTVMGGAVGSVAVFRAGSVAGNLTTWQDNASSVLASVSAAGLATFAGVTLTDATNLVFGTSTGTKIGTATSQKLGFYNATPIIRPSGSILTALSSLGLVGSPTLASTALSDTASLAYLASANTFTAGQTVAGSTDTQQLIVKGAVGQTVGLQHWRNSADTTLAYISAVGYAQFAGISSTANAFIDGSADNIQLRVQGHSVQNANLQTWESSAAAVVASVSGTGKGLFTSIGPTSGNFNILDSGGSIAIQVRTSDVTIPYKIIASATTGSEAFKTFGNAVMTVSNAANVPLQVRGYTAQSANLQTWENSSASVLASISAAGLGTFNDLKIDGINLNLGLGYLTHQSTSGTYNIALGYLAQRFLTTGTYCVAIGSTSNYFNQTGTSVTAIGYNAAKGASGNSHSGGTYIGYSSGSAITTGVNNIAIGFASGAYSTSQSYELFINSIDRSNRAGDIAGSIIYGVQNATAASQTLTLNAAVTAVYGLTSNAATSIVGVADVSQLTVKGASGQSNAIQEWQNNSGTVLTRIGASGFVGTQAGFGHNTSLQPYILPAAGSLTALSQNAAHIPWTVKGAASQSADLQTWINSSSTVLASVSAAGAGTFAGVTSTTGTFSSDVSVGAGSAAVDSLLTINGGTNTGKGGAIAFKRGGSSKGYLGTRSFVIGGSTDDISLISYADLTLGIGSMILMAMSSSANTLNAYSSTAIPVVAKGFSAQTANLFEAQTSGGAMLAAITAAGLHKWSSGNEQTTVGAAGGASALPATPTKYLKVVDSTGATLVIPAYAAA